MLNRRLTFCAAVVAVLAIVASAPATARAIGYYNVPGNCCQWCGYGCGAGYHAPLVLGPVSWWGCCAHGVERLPCSPRSPYAGCGYDCGGCGCDVGQPSMLEPTVEPMPAPAPSPEPAPAPAAFRVPFRY